MRIQRIEKTEQETTDLALHAELCSQRYEGILDKLETLDDKLTVAATAMLDLKEKMVTNNRDAIYLRWSGVVITALLGALLHLLTK